MGPDSPTGNGTFTSFPPFDKTFYKQALIEELDDTKKKLDTANCQICEMTSELNALKALCTEKDGEIASLRNTHHSMELELASELGNLQDMYNIKDTDLQQLREDHVALKEELKEFVDGKKETVFRLIDQFKEAKRKLESMRTQVCLCICICLCLFVLLCLCLYLRLSICHCLCLCHCHIFVFVFVIFSLSYVFVSCHYHCLWSFVFVKPSAPKRTARLLY